MERVKFLRLSDLAQLPRKQHKSDACFDCVAVSHIDHGNGVHEYGLGFAIQMPSGMRCDAMPRSSVHKTGLILSNCIGTIDEGYRGEIKAFFYHVIQSLPVYSVGDRIIQLRFEYRNDVEFQEVFHLDSSDRGDGGFGSTGR